MLDFEKNLALLLSKEMENGGADLKLGKHFCSFCALESIICLVDLIILLDLTSGIVWDRTRLSFWKAIAVSLISI